MYRASIALRGKNDGSHFAVYTVYLNVNSALTFCLSCSAKCSQLIHRPAVRMRHDRQKVDVAGPRHKFICPVEFEQTVIVGLIAVNN